MTQPYTVMQTLHTKSGRFVVNVGVSADAGLHLIAASFPESLSRLLMAAV